MARAEFPEGLPLRGLRNPGKINLWALFFPLDPLRRALEGETILTATPRRTTPQAATFGRRLFAMP